MNTNLAQMAQDEIGPSCEQRVASLRAGNIANAVGYLYAPDLADKPILKNGRAARSRFMSRLLFCASDAYGDWLLLKRQIASSRGARVMYYIIRQCLMPLLGRALVALVVVVGRSIEPPAVHAQAKIASSDVAGDRCVKFDKDSLAVVMPVRLAGASSPFFVDTGATITALDSRFRDKLGVSIKTVTVNTPDGRAEMEVFRLPHASAAGESLSGVNEVLCMDFSRLRAVVGINFYGVIGMDFLRHHIVRLDFDRGELSFLARVANTSDTSFALDVSPTQPPSITLDIAGAGEVVFILDTGASGAGSVDARVGALLLKKGAGTATGPIESESVLGSSTSSAICVKEISLGGFRHRGLVFERGSANVLGLAFLQRYIVTLDFPRKRA